MNQNTKLIRLYSRVSRTSVLGPFQRYGLWVQGCPFRCEGCLATATQTFEGGVETEVASLASEILEVSGIEGITISGGEPFAQPAVLARLLAEIRAEKDFGVIVYTGYRLEQLEARSANEVEVREVLAMTDILIDGPYMESLDDGLALRGSSNQRLHQLTDRYALVANDYYGLQERRVEVYLRNDEAMLVGVPSSEALAKWRRLIGEHGTDPGLSSQSSFGWGARNERR